MAYTDRFPIVNNFFETRLSADCDEGATTLYLESVDSLPHILLGRDYIPLVLRDAGTVREIVYVEAVDKDSGTVTVLRGQENTMPAAWSTGTYAYCTVTADSFQRMRVNGFAPLVADAGRPSITRTSNTTVNIAGDFSEKLEVGMAVRILAGDTVVEPADAEIGAIHITGVSFSAGVTSVSFQNVSLPTKVDGIDLGLSVAAAPMYHPDSVVADEDTLTQTQNVLRVSEKFKKELSDRDAAQNERDAAQDAAINAAQSSADAVASESTSGRVKLSDSTSSTSAASEGIAASPKAVKDAYDKAVAAYLPVGSVIAFAGNPSTHPSGYLLCNGAAVSRTTYAALFDVIGTTYGTGNGSSTFNLPDLNGRVIQGTNGDPLYIEAGLPNIAGGAGITGGNFLQISGAYGSLYALSKGYAVTGIQGSSANDLPINLGLDASRSSSVYGKSATVQPPALALHYYIKY